MPEQWHRLSLGFTAMNHGGRLSRLERQLDSLMLPNLAEEAIFWDGLMGNGAGLAFVKEYRALGLSRDLASVAKRESGLP